MDVGGRSYRVAHPASAEALIREEDFERDERLPYWADLWPSAIALARHVSGSDLVGRRVIELGCGVGLPSVVALARGAKVVVTDHYEAALDFAAYNARTNAGREPGTRVLDWQTPETEGLGPFDLVLAADVLYERRNIFALADLIPGLMSPDGETFLADPRRKDAPLFLRLMEERGFPVETEDAVVENGDRMVPVLIHRLGRRETRQAPRSS